MKFNRNFVILLVLLLFSVGIYAQELEIQEDEYDVVVDDLVVQEDERDPVISASGGEKFKRKRLSIDYYGAIFTDYFGKSELQLRPALGNDFDGSSSSTKVISEMPARITNVTGKELFFGHVINKHWSYEWVLNDFGEKTYQFSAGDKFTLDGKEYIFAEDSLIKVGGDGAGLVWKYDHFRGQKISTHIRIGGVLSFIETGGSGSYQLVNCSDSIFCSRQIDSFTVSGTGYAADNLFFYFPFHLSVGFDYALFRGVGFTGRI